MITFPIQYRQIFTLICLFIIGVYFRSPIFINATVFLYLSTCKFKWNRRVKLIFLITVTAFALFFTFSEISLTNKNNNNSERYIRNDTLFLENPVEEVSAKTFNIPDTAIRFCQVSISQKSILPLYYIFPAAGWRNLNKDILSAAALGHLKQIVLTTPHVRNHPIHYQITSMLYSLYTRDPVLSSGIRDTFTVDLIQPNSNPIRPDLLYWYPGPDRLTPFLNSNSTTPALFVVIILLTVVFCTTRHTTLFRVSNMFPAITSVLVTYSFLVNAPIPSSLKMFLILVFPCWSILAFTAIDHFFSVKMASIVFATWCILYYVYKNQIDTIITNNSNIFLFILILTMFTLITFFSTPKVVHRNFRMHLLGTGTGYILLSLHVFFNFSLILPTAAILLILSQSFGLGRLRRSI